MDFLKRLGVVNSPNICPKCGEKMNILESRNGRRRRSCPGCRRRVTTYEVEVMYLKRLEKISKKYHLLQGMVDRVADNDCMVEDL